MRDVLVRLELLAAWLKPGGPYPSEPIPDKYATLVEAIGEIKRLRNTPDAIASVVGGVPK